MEQVTEIKKKKAKINNKTVRFSGAPWYSPGIDIFIGGQGGIGSWLSLFLARQEANIFLFDYDVVDEVNLAGQLYGQQHIGLSKSQAMKSIVEDLCGHSQVEICGKYDEESMTNKYVFSAFDNMAARKLMFEKWAEEFKDDKEALFVDGRKISKILLGN